MKAVGAPGFVTVDTATTGPVYNGSWDSTGSLDGPTQVRVAVTDLAGNGPFYSAPVTFTADNTAPSVSIAAPADVAGSVSLGASGWPTSRASTSPTARTGACL